MQSATCVRANPGPKRAEAFPPLVGARTGLVTWGLYEELAWTIPRDLIVTQFWLRVVDTRGWVDSNGTWRDYDMRFGVYKPGTRRSHTRGAFANIPEDTVGVNLYTHAASEAGLGGTLDTRPWVPESTLADTYGRLEEVASGLAHGDLFLWGLSGRFAGGLRNHLVTTWVPRKYHALEFLLVVGRGFALTPSQVRAVEPWCLVPPLSMDRLHFRDTATVFHRHLRLTIREEPVQPVTITRYDEGTVVEFRPSVVPGVWVIMDNKPSGWWEVTVPGAVDDIDFVCEIRTWEVLDGCASVVASTHGARPGPEAFPMSDLRLTWISVVARACAARVLHSTPGP
jgi:hypothetical protein